jgi:hypothetical protein
VGFERGAPAALLLEESKQEVSETEEAAPMATSLTTRPPTEDSEAPAALRRAALSRS